VSVGGFDYYNTKTGQIESGSPEKIAMWMLDTNYDGRSLFPRQVFFPMAGDKEGWSKLARNLKAEIDEDQIESYRGTESLPFEAEKSDVDVMVTLSKERGYTLFDIVHMQDELGKIFGRKVHLSERPAVEQSRNHFRRRHILETAQDVYVVS